MFKYLFAIKMFANYNRILFENFNTTNQSSPLCLPHDNFVTDIQLPSCGMVKTLPPHQRCEYVKATAQCSEDVFLFDYVKFFFCNIDSGNPYMVLITLFGFIWVIATLFLILGSTADGFFCPSLKVLSAMMGLNENVAGVTLLAFGNCAPDFITNITGLNTESRRIYSDTLGGAFFVVFGVAGLIMTFVPFVTQGSNFLRDCCFLIFAVVYIDFAFRTDESINVTEGILILIIYFCYISVVVIDQYLIVRKLRELRNRNDLDIVNSEVFERLSKAASFEIISRNSRASRVSQALRSSFDYPGKKYANSKLFQQFLISINPIDMDEWEGSGKVAKMFMVIKSPIVLFLRCLIPVVDYELDDHGWSKLLNCIQCVTLPMFVLFATMEFYVYNIPLWALSSFVTTPLSILMFFTSRTDGTPLFQKYFAIIAAVGSVYIIYSCAAETISVLNVLGLVLHRSNSFLGCTLLAWGNSIGDLVSNISLARSGYQKMSFAACFGGPLFNILIGLGMGMTYKAATSSGLKTNKMNVADGTMGENTTIFMGIGLSILLFAACSSNFIMRRSLGIFMLLVYTLYFIVTLLGELEIIHTYGSDHRMDLKVEPVDY